MRVVFLVSLVLLSAMFGCGGGGGGGGTVKPIKVSVIPDIVPLQAGETQQFTAAVTGTNASQAVTWSVVEGNAGGMITSGGLYKAPPTGGIYHVEATSQTDNSAVGTATVTVTAPAQTGNVQGTIQ